MMRSIIMLLATGCYTGFLPKAPGTWGSLFALLPWLLLRNLTLPQYLMAVALLCVVGFFASGSAEKILDEADASPIVIDEIVGIMITLIAAPKHPAAPLVGLMLFRLFDIWKPFPISWIDQHIHGGLGIMADDMVAGVFACITLHLLWLLFMH